VYAKEVSCHLFSIFINDLLLDLDVADCGASIASLHVSNFAYADDVTVFSPTITGLQSLIDKCASYSNVFRFSFGIKKTRCMIVGKNHFHNEPEWTLNGTKIENASHVEILGNVFSHDLKSCMHVDKRISKCRGSYYNMSSIGMSYPGLSSDAKSYLWKYVCVPSLIYGIDAMCIDRLLLNKLESLQGCMIKQSLGLSKRSRHSAVLQALHVSPINGILKQRTLSLYQKIYNNNTVVNKLCNQFISHYMIAGQYVRNTLVGRIIDMGISPIQAASNNFSINSSLSEAVNTDGLVDSLRFVLISEHFIKPYSDDHILASLLTKAF
jgi:hypothetical protein